MILQGNTDNGDIKCPTCNSDALYRYGRSRKGRQRFLCLLCGRQFVPGAERKEAKIKCYCDECGKKMHVYKREKNFLRFRCSGYPECRVFKKIEIKEVPDAVLCA
jgi:transposase-like protein